MVAPSPSITSFDYDGREITLPAAAPVRHSEAAFARRLQEDAFGWPAPPRWMLDGLNPTAGQPFRGATGTTNDRKAGRDLPLYWNEMDLRGFRVLSRWLCDTNDFAIGFLGLLADYNIRKGFGWQCCRKGVKKTPYQTVDAKEDKLVQKGQAILDAWRGAGPYPWPLRSYEAFKRWCRDGEVGIRFFKGGYNRLPEARFISPEQIGSPDGDTDSPESFGIQTDPKDVETRWAFHIWEMDSGMARGEWVDADAIIFATKNTDTDVKRGLPDFFPVHEDLTNVSKLLRTMLLTSIRQASIAWREKYSAATQDQVDAVVPERTAGTGYARPANRGGGGDWPYWMGDPGQWGANHFDPGTVLKSDNNRDYEDGPTAGSIPNFSACAQASLRGCGVRWRFPEYFSGDASNNNMASAVVAGAPFTVATEGTQFCWGALIERPVALKLFDEAVVAGLLTQDERRQLDVEVTPPAVVTADPVKETQTYTAQLTARICCLDTARQKLGYDPQHEAEGIKKDDASKPQQPGPGGATTPGGAAGGKPGDPPADDKGGGIEELFGDESVSEGGAGTLRHYFRVTEAADRSQLRRKKITDKNGKVTWVWYNPKADDPGDRRSAAGYHGTATSEAAIAAALKDPGKIKHADIAALAEHLDALQSNRLKALARNVEAKLGKTKTEQVRILLAHVSHEIGASEEVPDHERTGPGSGKPRPGDVAEVSAGFLKVDPTRFQFKLNTNESGVTKELLGVKTFNPELAGVVSVWLDPEDGNTYVVNGHHRVELATRTGYAGNLAVRYIDAKDAVEARAKGALVNMAEGRGTAVDAAKFMRDMKVSPAKLEEYGISLKGKLASDAAVLTKVNDRAFHRLALGRLDPDRAIAVAKYLQDPERQERLFEMLGKREEEGKDYSNRTVEQMAKQMDAVPSAKKTNATLWGEEETDEDTFVERAELGSYVLLELAKAQNDFEAVASERRAGKVASAGNTLNIDENRRRADAAHSAKLLFDQHANLRGPVADALDAGAVLLKGAKTRTEKERVRTETLEAVRQAVATILTKLGPSNPANDGSGNG